MSENTIFVVGNSLQLEAASLVAGTLGSNACFLDLWGGKLLSDIQCFPGHTPPITINRICRLALSARKLRDSTVVLPQDVGMLQLLTGGFARRSGARLVLMPDGVASTSQNRNGNRSKQIIRKYAFGLLKLIGLVSSPGGIMGGSNPDIILSWGPGWADAYQLGEQTKIVHTGSPRSDRYSNLPDAADNANLLICSQPLYIPAWTRPYASRWYDFLLSTAKRADYGQSIRIRLHPAEIKDESVPAELKKFCIERTLDNDLGWASQVASPFSTVLLDALAADRSVVALYPDDAFAAKVSDIPFFADSLVPRCKWSVDEILSAQMSTESIIELREKYLAFAGSSARRTADVLGEVIRRVS